MFYGVYGFTGFTVLRFSHSFTYFTTFDILCGLDCLLLFYGFAVCLRTFTVFYGVHSILRVVTVFYWFLRSFTGFHCISSIDIFVVLNVSHGFSHVVTVFVGDSQVLTWFHWLSLYCQHCHVSHSYNL